MLRVPGSGGSSTSSREDRIARPREGKGRSGGDSSRSCCCPATGNAGTERLRHARLRIFELPDANRAIVCIHFRRTPMIAHFILTRTCGRVLALIALAALLPVASIDLRAAGDEGRQAPNYELASQWTLPKINKLIFDTQVTPHWLEFSDRFWYSYETRDGKRYFLVDPSKAATKSVKAPLFDNAKLAAMLAAATLVPMDAQHLPIKSLKFSNKDTGLQIELEVPKDADIPGLKKKPATTTTAQDQGDEDYPQQQRPGTGARA